MDFVFLGEFCATGTFSIDVFDYFSRFWFIIFVRKPLEASLTKSKIALIVIINSSIADSSADSTNITDIVYRSNSLKVKGMAYGTTFFWARRNPTANTVELWTNSTVGSAYFLLLTLEAFWIYHLLVWAYIKFKKVVLKTSILLLKLFQPEFLGRHKLAFSIVTVKLVERSNGSLT